VHCGILANHYPFIAVTLGLPALDSALIILVALLRARRRFVYAGDNTASQILGFLSVILPLFLGLPFFKAAYDYTYITSVAVAGETGSARGFVPTYWNTIGSDADLEKYKLIVSCLSKYYLAAGVLIGLSLFYILARDHVDTWILHFASMLIGPILFVILEAAPLKGIIYGVGYAHRKGIPLGVSPFDTIAKPSFYHSIIAGLTIGILLSILLYYIIGARRSWARRPFLSPPQRSP